MNILTHGITTCNANNFNRFDNSSLNGCKMAGNICLNGFTNDVCVHVHVVQESCDLETH